MATSPENPAAPTAPPAVQKLSRLAEDLRRGESFNITRLTALKRLCQEPAIANRFVAHLARRTLERAAARRGKRGAPRSDKSRLHRQLMTDALAAVDAYCDRPNPNLLTGLRDLLRRMREEQNEHRNIPWGAVRIIDDMDLLRVEYAVRCVLEPHAAGHWAYHAARCHAERYDPRHGAGLVPESAPYVQDILDFWGASPEQPAQPRRRK